jgi:methionyl-tRNA formyltransferase
MLDPKQIRILFLGTPEFAATILQRLLAEKANVVAVVTAPDKPSGRGLQVHQSAVKQVALEHSLFILQPEKLKNPEFLEVLKSFEIDLAIVVAFRMLPEVVWQMPKMGTFNLHASLLPQYRGAAPINWAIMNGETETGITTFFLQHEIDTGNLLLQEKVEIGPNENVGSLYDRLMHKGADLVWKTVEGIADKTLTDFPQKGDCLKHAPKIFKDDCLLDFSVSAEQVHNKIRGLAPIPGSFMNWNGKIIKIFSSELTSEKSDLTPGTFRQISSGVLAVSTGDYWLILLEIQPEGKRKMSAKEFLAGHKIEKI